MSSHEEISTGLLRGLGHSMLTIMIVLMPWFLSLEGLDLFCEEDRFRFGGAGAIFSTWNFYLQPSSAHFSSLSSAFIHLEEDRRRRKHEGRDHCRLNNMSAVDEEAADTMLGCCASCGKVEVDDVKLKMCTACKLVKYCSVDCQKNHRPQHKKACRKRAAEIRDDNLFRQPDESHLGECPICCLPLPLDLRKFALMACCCKRICDGCNHANKLREAEQGLEHKCPYCREPMIANEEIHQNLMKRVKVNDPVALFEMGIKCQEEGDIGGAIQYWTKAATLGNMIAHYNLSLSYQLGDGVEKDKKKEVYHLEEATIGGHPDARYNLGIEEVNSGRTERGMKHLVIATNLGHDESLEAVSKEDYASALRGHQAAVDATKSEQREEAYAFKNLSREEQDEQIHRLLQSSRH